MSLICMLGFYRLECCALQKHDFQKGVALEESLKTNLPWSAFSSESGASSGPGYSGLPFKMVPKV